MRYYYQNAHHKMVVRYQNRELCTMRATDARLIYTYVPNTCEANAKGYNDAEHDYEKIRLSIALSSLEILWPQAYPAPKISARYWNRD